MNYLNSFNEHPTLPDKQPKLSGPMNANEVSKHEALSLNGPINYIMVLDF